MYVHTYSPRRPRPQHLNWIVVSPSFWWRCFFHSTCAKSKCVLHTKHSYRWCVSFNPLMLILHWHLYNLHCVVMYTVVACDGGMIMFVNACVCDGSASYKPCFLLIIAVKCKRYPDHSNRLTGPNPAYPWKMWSQSILQCLLVRVYVLTMSLPVLIKTPLTFYCYLCNFHMNDIITKVTA